MNHHKNERNKSSAKYDRRERDDETKYEYGKNIKTEETSKPIEKEKPSLALSGNLAKDTNVFNGVVIKYNEPPEARKPRKRWRLYCFKGETELPFYPVHRQSAYLFGRDRLVADIPTEHPSCSKQHAAFQYRLVEYKRKDGTNGRTIKPYIIDLGSTNGTFVNNQQIEAQRYFELREKDVLKFGFSSREYVLLHEESKNDLNEFDEDLGEDILNETESVQIKKEKESDIDEDLKRKSSKLSESSKSKNRKSRSSSRSSGNRSSSSDSDDDKKRKKLKSKK